jgi:hypothetical protein
MAKEDKSETTPTPANRIAKNIKVRVVKQPVRHEGKTYHGPRQGDNGPLEAETFMATQEQIDNYGERLVEPVEA